MPHRSEFSRMFWPAVGPHGAVGEITDAELSQIRSTMTSATLAVGIFCRLLLAGQPWGSWACWLIAVAAGLLVGWWGRLRYKAAGPADAPASRARVGG